MAIPVQLAPPVRPVSLFQYLHSRETRPSLTNSVSLHHHCRVTAFVKTATLISQEFFTNWSIDVRDQVTALTTKPDISATKPEKIERPKSVQQGFAAHRNRYQDISSYSRQAAIGRRKGTGARRDRPENCRGLTAVPVYVAAGQLCSAQAVKVHQA